MTDEQFERLMTKLDELKQLVMINGQPTYQYPPPLINPYRPPEFFPPQWRHTTTD